MEVLLGVAIGLFVLAALLPWNAYRFAARFPLLGFIAAVPFGYIAYYLFFVWEFRVGEGAMGPVGIVWLIAMAIGIVALLIAVAMIAGPLLKAARRQVRRPGLQSIVRTTEGFTVVDGGHELFVRLSDLIAAEGTKVDQVTYEENFLVLTHADGAKIPIGELADGFAELERAISTSLRGFPKEWKVAVESLTVGKSVSLWVR